MSASKLFIVVVAAGEGTRFGAGGRKAAVPIRGIPLVGHALRALAGSPGAQCGALVVHPADMARARGEWVPAHGGALPWAVLAGGATRADSVAAGLAALPASAEIILVHDAARPLLHPEDRDAVIAAAAAHGAAILAAPVADTLKRVERDRIVAEVARDGVWGAQTPQVFTRAALARAAAAGPPGGTDEAGWLARGGVEVRVVAARHPNPKVTRGPDATLAEALLALRTPE